jgi:hypothetical protein
MDPDTMYSLQALSIDTAFATIYFGDLADGHTVNDIDPTDVLVNGSITPESWQLLPSHPDFIGEVMEITVVIAEFVQGYLPLWDTTTQEYLVIGTFDDGYPKTAFTVVGDVTLIGHTTGDITNDGIVNMADLVYLINYLFRGGVPPRVPQTADIDHNGLINVADVTSLVDFLFR